VYKQNKGIDMTKLQIIEALPLIELKRKRVDNLKYLIFLIMFSVSCNLFAQDKFEKESRIRPKDVPSKALSFIDSLNWRTSIKWYQEEGLNQKSIEAKFKGNKLSYSLEFDSLGMIEDIEIEVNWGELEPGLKESISSQLQQNCTNHLIVKVQRQFTGSEKDLFALLKTGKIFDGMNIKYEIIVRCKQENKVDLFEYLFNNQGKLISTSKIVFKNSSHLEY
jgi:hypothetical protein